MNRAGPRPEDSTSKGPSTDEGIAADGKLAVAIMLPLKEYDVDHSQA